MGVSGEGAGLSISGSAIGSATKVDADVPALSEVEGPAAFVPGGSSSATSAAETSAATSETEGGVSLNGGFGLP